MKQIFQSSRVLKFLLWGIGIVIVLLVTFKAGEFVGSNRAEFSYRWGENYYRSVTGPKQNLPGDIRGQDFLMDHGTLGSIIKISSSTLTIKDRDGTEKDVLISSGTTIRSFRNEISASDLKIDDQVTIIGSPNDAGQIDAKLIRVLPPMPPVAPNQANPVQ